MYGRLSESQRKKELTLAVELLVPLTWPFEIDPVEATVNHHRHGPYVQLAQIGYKRAILQFDRDRTLQTAVKVALPSMAIPLRERSPRDEGLIRIALYFIRNIAMLSPPCSVPMDIDEAEVSRSTTIDTFQEQDIFQVILSMSSSIGEDFIAQDVVLLEILFFLLKGIDAEKLFLADKKLNSKNANELKELMQKEKAMLAGYNRTAPTRHNRFGTMIWLKQEDEKVTTVSGQDVLGKAQATLEKMDQTKKWNKPRRPGRKTDLEQEREEFDLPVSLSTTARTHIKAFVEEFLDSSFNPLFQHLRKAIERETERVEMRHSRQFFYLVSWFLRAECARRRTIKDKAADRKSAAVLTAEDESYGLIAEVMNQETFILLNRFMQKSQDEKAWQDLNAGMKCFTQILLTVQEMSESGVEDDQEIAENIQNRIFYEESTHDRVVMILRSYKDQGFGYLDAVTELSHVFLRMLERYAKQNVDMQIKSKRRARKIKKKQAQAEGAEGEDEGHVSETEDLQQAQKTVTERKFDFNRFAAKFVNQSSVNTFVAFTRYYADLDTEQLKRAHRFFHRVAYKMELGVLLCRVDIIHLFNEMMKGRRGLDQESPAYKEWDDFVKHLFRQVIKRVQERPELIVEMLFSKIPQTLYFLEHGHDREVFTRAPRPPAELEVKPGMEKPEQVGVAVGVLVNQQKSDALHWVRDVLTSAVEERKAWEDAEQARKELAAAEVAEGETATESTDTEAPTPPSIREYPHSLCISSLISLVVKHDTTERKVAMFKDNKLRLLMTLVGFMRLGANDDPDATWVIPSSLSSTELQEAVDLIRKFEFDPPIYEDGKGPEDLLRSKAVAARRSTRRADFDDDSDGIDQDSEEDRGEYAVDEPTARKPDSERRKLKRRRRARTPMELDDEEREAKAEARRRKEIEKQAKTKSTMFVHDSDDDEWDADKDAAFFAREQQLREDTLKQFKKLLVLGTVEPAVSKKELSKKRKAEDTSKKSKRRKSPPKRKAGPFDDSDEDEDADDAVSVSSRAPSEAVEDVMSNAESEDEATDTPLSSQHAGSKDDTPRTLAPTITSKTQDITMVDDDDDDDAPVVRRPAARNMRAGFIIDSDSE